MQDGGACNPAGDAPAGSCLLPGRENFCPYRLHHL